MYITPLFTYALTSLRILVILSFLINTLGPLPLAKADDLYLPAPGVMVQLSPEFDLPVIKGIKLDPKNPFKLHFFVDRGDSGLSVETPLMASLLKKESGKLIKYFLASLAIPEKDLWVNLSPYEKDRIVPEEFGQTEMGRDLLAEDYMLKQITASLIYPESQLGKEFWAKIYAQAQTKYGTTNIPINTFNKVWIVPEKAVVYENNGVAFVIENHLKVMLEEDYLAMHKNQRQPANENINSLGSNIVRQIVIPALTKEVNEGKNFAELRQVFYSLILATWYKTKIKDSILNRVYSNRNRISGLNVSAQDKNKIYQEYLKAFKKGVYNYIKEESDPITNQTIPRKYFSGGIQAGKIDLAIIVVNRQNADPAALATLSRRSLVDLGGDAALTSKLPSSLKDEAMIDYQSGLNSFRTLAALDHVRSMVIISDKDIPWGRSILQLGYFTKSILTRWPQMERIYVITPYPEIVEKMDKRITALSPDQISLFPKGQKFDALIDFSTGRSMPALTIGGGNLFSFNVRNMDVHTLPFESAAVSRPVGEIINDKLKSLGLPVIDGNKPFLDLHQWDRSPSVILVNPLAMTNMDIKPDTLDRWADLIKKLLAENYKVVLNGGGNPADISISRMIADRVGEHKDFEVKGFQTTKDFVEFMAQNVKAVVTIDTGVFHAAWELLRLPTIALTTQHSSGWIPQEQSTLKELPKSEFLQDPTKILAPLEQVIKASQDVAMKVGIFAKEEEFVSQQTGEAHEIFNNVLDKKLADELHRKGARFFYTLFPPVVVTAEDFVKNQVAPSRVQDLMVGLVNEHILEKIDSGGFSLANLNVSGFDWRQKLEVLFPGEGRKIWSALIEKKAFSPASHLHSAVGELIYNAVKYSKDKKASVAIEVDPATKGGVFRLTIRQNMISNLDWKNLRKNLALGAQALNDREQRIEDGLANGGNGLGAVASLHQAGVQVGLSYERREDGSLKTTLLAKIERMPNGQSLLLGDVAMRTVVSIGEFFDFQNREMNPKALAAIVDEVRRQTIRKWGQGLKLGDFEVLISGGVRYLQSGKRKDVDIVFNFPTGLKKDIEASSIAGTFIELFDEKIRNLKGIKGYAFVNALPSDVGEIDILSFNIAQGSQEKHYISFDFIYPKRIKQKLKFETDDGGKYLNSSEEIILDGVRSNLQRGILTSNDSSYFKMSLENIKNYLAAEYYLAKEGRWWEKFRPIFLKVDGNVDDKTVESETFLNLIGTDGVQVINQRCQSFLLQINDQQQRPALLKLIGQRLRQSLVSKKVTGDEAMNVPKHEGGINLNPEQMSLQIKKEGEDFKFDFNGTEIDTALIIGATFTIRTMTPVNNLPLILGLNQDFVAKSNV